MSSGTGADHVTEQFTLLVSCKAEELAHEQRRALCRMEETEDDEEDAGNGTSHDFQLPFEPP